MPIYTLKLIDKREVARSTIEFKFEKPQNFQFTPGQYGGFTLLHPSETDAGGITRRFSIASTPSDQHLAITLRMQSSAYKRVLNTLPMGSEIKFAGPTGNFILHTDNTIPAVFIAGGIGITPFYSIIKHALSQGSNQSLYLFYGNQSPKDTAYLQELTALQNQHPNFKFIATMVSAEDHWQGEVGFITHTMIRHHVPDIKTPIYYICGSPVMVTTLQETLAEMDIDENKIKVEDFPGY